MEVQNKRRANERTVIRMDERNEGKRKEGMREGGYYLREQITGRIEKWMEKYIREALNKKCKFTSVYIFILILLRHPEEILLVGVINYKLIIELQLISVGNYCSNIPF